MEEIFLFKKQLNSGDHTHTVIVSETIQPGNEKVYNCIIDIHTNIQLVHDGSKWMEKEKGVTAFAALIGPAIAVFIEQRVDF